MIDPVRRHRLVPMLLLVISIGLILVGQLTAKHGALILAGGWERWVAAAPFVLIAYGIFLVRGFLWVVILKSVALSLAYPMLAIAYVAVLAASAALFGDAIGVQKGIGAGVVLLGVLLVGLSKLNGEAGR